MSAAYPESTDQSINHYLEGMDQEVLNRFAQIVRELRGADSQREFADRVGVAQSTIASWEAARNTPSLENLEKLASMRGELPEELLASLYGREPGQSLELQHRFKAMSAAEILKLIQSWMETNQ